MDRPRTDEVGLAQDHDDVDRPLDPDHPGGVPAGGAVGASQAPIGQDDVTRDAIHDVEAAQTTEELAEQLHERLSGRSQHA